MLFLIQCFLWQQQCVLHCKILCCLSLKQMVALYQLFVCYCKAVKVLNQRISWHLYFNPNNQGSNYRNSLYYVTVINSIKYSQISTIPQFLRSPADSKITRCAPLFQRKSQVELKCKLAIRRSDSNYSLNGLYSKLKSVFKWLQIRGFSKGTSHTQRLTIYKGNINTIKGPSKINKVNTATDLQFVSKFNALFQ